MQTVHDVTKTKQQLKINEYSLSAIIAIGPRDLRYHAISWTKNIYYTFRRDQNMGSMQPYAGNSN